MWKCLKSGFFAEAFFLGIFILLVYTELFRTVMSSTGGSEFILPAVAIPVMLIASLTSILLLIPRKAKRGAAFEFLYLLCGYLLTVFVLSLLHLICVSSTMDIRRNLIFPESDGLLLLIYLLASAIAGASTGLVYGTFFSRGALYEEQEKFVYGTLSGFLTGAALIQILSWFPFRESFVCPMAGGIVFLLAALINGIGKSNLKFTLRGVVVCLFLFSLAAFSAGVFLMVKHAPQRFFSRFLNSSIGKYEFSEYGVFFNGKTRKLYEYAFDFDKMLVLVSSLQNNRSGQKALLITNPGTSLTVSMEIMPHIEKVDVLVPDAVAAGVISSALFPKNKIRMSTADPIEFLKRKQTKYDLVVIGISDIYSLAMHRYYMLETIQAAGKKMRSDGVFAMRLPNPPGYSPEAVETLRRGMIATVKRVFPNVAYTTGRTGILVASSNSSLTFSPNVLEKRLEKLTGGRKVAPSGLFYIVGNLLLSESRRAESGKEVQGTESREFNPEIVRLSWRNNPFFSGRKFEIPLKLYDFMLKYYIPVLAGLFFLYLLLRYFLSFRLDVKMLFTSFENGFYTLGTFSLLLFLFQVKTGSLYANLPYLIGIFSAGAISGGILSGRMENTRAMHLVAGILPVVISLFSLLDSRCAFLSLFASSVVIGICSGYAYFDFRRKSGDGLFSVLIPPVTLFGASFGIFVIAALALPAGGLPAAVILLCLSRISRILNG